MLDRDGRILPSVSVYIVLFMLIIVSIAHFAQGLVLFYLVHLTGSAQILQAMSAAAALDNTEPAEVGANDVPLSYTKPILRVAPPLNSQLKANAQASRERRGHVPMPQRICSGERGADCESPPIRILAYGDSLTAGTSQ